MNMEPNAQQPTQATNKPVMDVVPPPKSSAPSPESADGVKTPPLSPSDPAQAAEAASKKDQPKQKVAKPPKAPRSGAGLAIAATVIIVLGLAALFVYAYLRTNGISVR